MEFFVIEGTASIKERQTLRKERLAGKRDACGEREKEGRGSEVGEKRERSGREEKKRRVRNLRYTTDKRTLHDKEDLNDRRTTKLREEITKSKDTRFPTLRFCVYHTDEEAEEDDHGSRKYSPIPSSLRCAYFFSRSTSLTRSPSVFMLSTSH